MWLISSLDLGGHTFKKKKNTSFFIVQMKILQYNISFQVVLD